MIKYNKYDLRVFDKNSKYEIIGSYEKSNLNNIYIYYTVDGCIVLSTIKLTSENDYTAILFYHNNKYLVDLRTETKYSSIGNFVDRLLNIGIQNISIIYNRDIIEAGFGSNIDKFLYDIK